MAQWEAPMEIRIHGTVAVVDGDGVVVVMSREEGKLVVDDSSPTRRGGDAS
jgi:hypothetical protein